MDFSSFILFCFAELYFGFRFYMLILSEIFNRKIYSFDIFFRSFVAIFEMIHRPMDGIFSFFFFGLIWCLLFTYIYGLASTLLNVLHAKKKKMFSIEKVLETFLQTIFHDDQLPFRWNFHLVCCWASVFFFKWLHLPKCLLYWMALFNG